MMHRPVLHHEIVQTLTATPGFRLIDVDDTALSTPEGSWAPPHSLRTAMRDGVFCGSGRTNVDFSVFKQFAATEKLHLQLRAEFFNVLNHPQFDLPGQTIGSPSAGVITATVGTPRDIQFSLRLLF